MDSTDPTGKTSSPISSRCIPNELIGKIIKELAKRYLGGIDGTGRLTEEALEALRQCSLVNPDFRVYSQQEIFGNLTVGRDNVKRVSTLLRDGPHICDMVKTVQVECRGVLDSDENVLEAEESDLCIPLLQCRKITRLILYGPCSCRHWTPGIQAYYTELCSVPGLGDLFLCNMFRFPIHILQKSSSLQTLSFSASLFGFAKLKVEPSEMFGFTDHELAFENTPLEKTVFLRKLRISDGGSFDCFLSRILSSASCLDVRNLHALTLDELGDSLAQSKLKSLQDAIHLCSNSLTSFKVNNIQAFLSLNCDPLVRLQHFQFQLPADCDGTTNWRNRARYSLVPSIVDWLKRYAPNITHLTIECNDDVPVDGSGTAPHSEQWMSIDNAFKPSLSGLEALKRVQLAIVWHWDRRSDFDEQVRLAEPFLSVLQPKVTRFNHWNPEQDSDPE